MIDVKTQPNIPYVYELTMAIRKEWEKLEDIKRKEFIKQCLATKQ
jgi:hypothetical protein